jgi:hypothetical protein
LPPLQRDTKLESFDSFTQLDLNISLKQTATVSFAVFPQKLDYLGGFSILKSGLPISEFTTPDRELLFAVHKSRCRAVVHTFDSSNRQFVTYL